MLHTKFLGNRPAGSGEEDFLRVVTIYWRGSHLGHLSQMPGTNFCSLPKEAPHKIWLSLARWSQRYSCLKVLTDARTHAGSTGILLKLTL